MAIQIEDHRCDTSYEPEQYLVATDKVMSGWGRAPGKSYVAYDLAGLSFRQIKKLEEWMGDRRSYIRVRYNENLPRGTSDDHVSVYDPPADVIGES